MTDSLEELKRLEEDLASMLIIAGSGITAKGGSAGFSSFGASGT